MDLRDDALADLGIKRDGLVSTTAAHYPCTRQWAEMLHRRRGIGAARPVGLMWQSRVAELASGDSPLFADLLRAGPAEVFVLFGERLASTDPAAFRPSVIADDLTSPAALPLVAAIAEQLGATLA